MSDEAGLVLSHAELVQLTGYERPHEQLQELQRRGYHRAHRNRLGNVVLTRAHFEAVERGAASGWLEHEVEAWLALRVAARPASQPTPA